METCACFAEFFDRIVVEIYAEFVKNEIFCENGGIGTLIGGIHYGLG